MKRIFKYRLYPNKTQIGILNQTFNLCKNLYNACLEQRIIAYKQFKKSINKYNQFAELPNLKKEMPDYNNVHSQVLQDVIKRVDLAYQKFFKTKKGFPRFKSFDRYHSITYPQIYKLKFKNKRIFIPKVGFVKIEYHRDVPDNAQIKLLTITKHCNKFFLCINFEIPNAPKKAIDLNKVVGIDMGIENFATLSDGEIIQYPKFLKQSENKLKLAQQNLSRKQKGSNRRKQAKKYVAKIHEKIRNQRSDFMHKESRKIANKFDVVCFEDLKIQQMLNNGFRGLNKSINDNSWAKFTNMISYKVETLGGHIIKVNPRNTSQICSQCGQIVKKDLSIRVHQCPFCGLSIHRDLNASLNIKRLGTSLLLKKSEANEFIHW